MEYSDKEWASLHMPLTIKNAREILNGVRERLDTPDARYYLVCVPDSVPTWVVAARGCAGINIRVWDHAQLESGLTSAELVLGDPTIFMFHDSHISKRPVVRQLLIAIQSHSALANARAFMVQTEQVFHV